MKSYSAWRQGAGRRCQRAHITAAARRVCSNPAHSAAAAFAPRRQPARTARASTVAVRADYYSALGVSKGADKKEIKSAYRKMARQFHPDVNKEAGAEDKFKEISEAYEVLSDEEKRQIYDTYGKDGLKGAGQGFGGGAGFSNPFDIFESMFQGMGGMGGGMGGMGGGGRGGPRPQRGADEQVDIRVEFDEAVFGCAREIEVNRLSGCDACEGSGQKAGTTPTTCSQCQGQGVTVSVVRTPLGVFQQQTVCQQCSGSGMSTTPCGTCGGDGRVRRAKKISVTVPAGIEHGTRLRITGEGSAGRKGGPPGDLFVLMGVKEHPELRREGMTVYSDVSVSYIDAILGTTIKVTTVDGLVDLKIPAGTQPGTTLLLAKRGSPAPNRPAAERGNHMVKVKVTIPKKLSGDERKLVEELARQHEDSAAKIKVGPFSL